MQLLLAGVVYVVASLAFGAVWYIALFKAKYDVMSGGFQREAPIPALGMAAILINMVLTLWLFTNFYPAGQMDLTLALGLTALVMIPNISYAALVMPAKYKVAGVTGFVLMELAFGAILIVVLGAALAVVFSRGGA